ncbi:HAD family hydrolase [Shewanella salipaludis]|uniref:HAD-IA family hydrolase n=1 Tax=Shewanella salipaludis TaxID=2723052 RepID=A0A972FWA7_9GAMM|nr:HAD-IA family hydrolase [Shewanella salipaludis]NMH63812.1 HAD-IA family hydrolase [Shewanella salipaludis]
MTLTGVAGVLFDLDGTLVDTAPDLVQALNLALADAGFDSQPLATLRHAASHGSLALVRAALPHAEADMQHRVQTGLLAHYQRINGDHSSLFAGVPELLALLEQQQRPFGIITNKPARFTRPLLDKLALTPRLDCIISGDSTRFAKPHTAPMLLGAQQLGHAPGRLLYIGDAERDLVAAQNACMQGAIALWGYIGAGDDPLNWPAIARFARPQAVTTALSFKD